MEWSNDLSLQLIDEYEKWPILWDPKHEDHFSRNKKGDAYQRIADNLKKEVFEVKQKLNSLLGSFRREKAKGKKSIGTGKGRREIYVTRWFAFERMQFLLDKDEPRPTINTDQEMEQSEDFLDDNSVLSIEETEIHNSSGPTLQPDEGVAEPSQRTLSVPPNKKQKKNTPGPDPRLEEAYQIMKASLNKGQSQDSFFIYGQHIANKLRGYSRTTQVEVEHAIGNILYNADKGFYERFAPPRHPVTSPNYAFVNENPSPASSSFPSSTPPSTHPIDMSDIDYTHL